MFAHAVFLTNSCFKWHALILCIGLDVDQLRQIKGKELMNGLVIKISQQPSVTLIAYYEGEKTNSMRKSNSNSSFRQMWDIPDPMKPLSRRLISLLLLDPAPVQIIALVACRQILNFQA